MGEVRLRIIDCCSQLVSEQSVAALDNEITTVSASGYTGGLTMTAGTGGVAVTTGSGADDITGGAGDDTINTGAGADNVAATAGGDELASFVPLDFGADAPPLIAWISQPLTEYNVL